MDLGTKEVVLPTRGANECKYGSKTVIGVGKYFDRKGCLKNEWSMANRKWAKNYSVSGFLGTRFKGT